MGVAFKDLIVSKEIALSDLKDKIIAIDSFNMLYQFLTTIRARDGSLLTDKNGHVTSHIIGLFSRVTTMMENGLKPIFVFDGVAPELKKKERERRAEVKAEAKKEYEIAKQRQDIELMKKYASRTTKLTPEMINDAKQLIELLGLPIVQAKSEGEAQAAFMVKNKDAYACVSQDFDTLLHGSTNLIRNLSIAGKRKRTNKLGYVTVKPEIINLADNLNHLKLGLDQLIVLAMLIGTDYNIGGVKGLGPKKALKLVSQHSTDFDALFKEAKWEEHCDIEWEEIFYLIKQMPINKDYSIKFSPPNFEGIISFLCGKHDFDKERVEKTLNKISEANDIKQRGLGDFF